MGILTWRWKEEEKKENEAEKEKEVENKSKSRSKPKRKKFSTEREFFVKYKDQSYWHASWIKEIQLDVFHPQTYRMYLRKNDMDEPPRFDEDGEDENLGKRLKHHQKEKPKDPYQLHERFFRYGIRPEWLQIHHILNRRQSRDGSYEYFIKWRDLPYVDSSWESEDMEIPDYSIFILDYEDLRYVCGADGKKK